MKKLCAILLLISSNTSLIAMEKQALTSSNPINILKTSFEDGQQTGNSSPGRFRLANRVVNEDEKLQTERERAIKEYQDDILAAKITDFISNQARLIIKEIIQDKHKESFIGDPQIDQELGLCLEKLKEKKITSEQSKIEIQPREDVTNFKIRSNRDLCNEMDKEISSLALLVNKIIRFSHSK